MRDEHTKISIPIAAKLLTQYHEAIEQLLWLAYDGGGGMNYEKSKL